MQTVLPFLFVKTHATKTQDLIQGLKKMRLTNQLNFFFSKNLLYNKLNYFDWLYIDIDSGCKRVFTAIVKHDNCPHCSFLI